jgi:hypothetical protein
MTVANSTQPLRVASILGLTLAFACAAHVVYVLAVRLFSPAVAPGWATLQIFQSTMFAFLFVMLATLCEYMGRLLGEVKDRPLYFVLEERSSSVLLVDEHAERGRRIRLNGDRGKPRSLSDRDDVARQACRSTRS